MLEGITIVLGVIIELVRIRKEITTRTERITTAYVRTGQTDLLRLLNREHVLRRAVKRFAYLIADIGVGILIRDDLHRILHARGTMISSEHKRETQLGRTAQQFVGRRMSEPTERQTAVFRLIIRQLAHHLTLRTRM